MTSTRLLFRRERRVALCALLCLGACSQEAVPMEAPLAFDSARAVIHGPRGDSAAILVEMATTDAQRSHGLSRITSLDAASGMLFRFDTTQSGDDGFWMWRTRIPLDIAFLDSADVVRRVFSMEPTCPDAIYPQACPEFKPGVAYRSALEVNRGWFASHGFAVGATLATGPRR